MRIGAFAEKYNMNVSAVRYYVERGLLTPQRRNNQYVFDDDCMKDMEKILRYKSFHFSLSEIELLFFLQRNSQLQDQSVSRQFLELLNKKKLQLNQDLDTLQQTIKDLDEEIYRSTQKTETASLKKRMPGIPLMSGKTGMPALQCSAPNAECSPERNPYSGRFTFLLLRLPCHHSGWHFALHRAHRCNPL